MEELTLVLVSILTFCLAFYLMISQISARRSARGSARMSRVLLVTAHPDDEVSCPASLSSPLLSFYNPSLC